MALPRTLESVHDESMPLLAARPSRKHFYRARPLWLVPFAVVASLTRSMTLAPRLEVFTQLSCNSLYGHHRWNHTQSPASIFSSDIVNTPFYASPDPPAPLFHPYTLFRDSEPDDSDTDDPRSIPSGHCVSDPAVQAGAARLSAIMTTTMGLLSALTTGWWGNFGERHGRKKVLVFSTLGLCLTDLMFILVSTPSSPLSKHGHKLLLISPIIEGLLGGYSTLQSATSAYLSDCTSSGSRATIFSRFTGVMYIGSSVGPIIGGWLIRHPIEWIGGSSIPGRQSVTSVFWVAVFSSFINFLSMAFVFPESLDKEKRKRALIAYQKSGTVARQKGKARALTLSSGDLDRLSTDEEDSIEERNRPSKDESDCGPGGAGLISRLLSPLAVFLPALVLDPSNMGRKRRDWSLTFLAAALFGYMLSTGVTSTKYLYGRHIYGWDTEQLSYYISLMGGLRAIFLLFLLPTFISFFKPKPLPFSDQKGKGRPPILSKNSNASISTVQRPQRYQLQPNPLQKDKKTKPTRAQLGREISFDLLLTGLSLMIDILSQSLIMLFPAPSLKANNLSSMPKIQGQLSFTQRQAMFVAASSLSGMGSGVVPAIHSLALCLLQVRGSYTTASNVDREDADTVETKKEGAGTLFGAFAVLQTVGQMILAPMIFGLVYSGTVANFPKAIFTVAATFLVCALTLVLFVTNPVRQVSPGRPKKKKNRRERDIERGRSRVSKDLRGGAIQIVNYGSPDGSGRNSS